MSDDSRLVSEAHHAKLFGAPEDSSAPQNSVRSYYNSQLETSLISSLRTQNGKAVFSITDALQKIELLSQSCQDSKLNAWLDSVGAQLEKTAPNNLNSVEKIRAWLNAAIQQQLGVQILSHQDHVQLSIRAAATMAPATPAQTTKTTLAQKTTRMEAATDQHPERHRHPDYDDADSDFFFNRVIKKLKQLLG